MNERYQLLQSRQIDCMQKEFTWEFCPYENDSRSVRKHFANGLVGGMNCMFYFDDDKQHDLTADSVMEVEFSLEEEGTCFVHMEVSLLDKHDIKIRTVSHERHSDLCRPPIKVGTRSYDTPCIFMLSDEEISRAVHCTIKPGKKFITLHATITFWLKPLPVCKIHPLATNQQHDSRSY